MKVHLPLRRLRQLPHNYLGKIPLCRSKCKERPDEQAQRDGLIRGFRFRDTALAWLEHLGELSLGEVLLFPELVKGIAELEPKLYIGQELLFGWDRLPSSRRKADIEDYLFQVESTADSDRKDPILS